jgi:hypothetical protein
MSAEGGAIFSDTMSSCNRLSNAELTTIRNLFGDGRGLSNYQFLRPTGCAVPTAHFNMRSQGRAHIGIVGTAKTAQGHTWTSSGRPAVVAGPCLKNSSPCDCPFLVPCARSDLIYLECVLLLSIGLFRLHFTARNKSRGCFPRRLLQAVVRGKGLRTQGNM